MKDEDFIERKEKVLLAALGKSWLWKASRLIIGIIPPVGAFVMLVHCTLLSFGIRVKLTEWIFDCSFFGFIAWIIISLAYGFCWVHRAFATYGVLISFCIDFQRSFGFGFFRVSKKSGFFGFFGFSGNPIPTLLFGDHPISS